MSDLVYGGGGGGGGYYPPSFDPNNPMGGGGSSGYYPYVPPPLDSENRAYVESYVSNIQHLDSQYNSEYFSTNFNNNNPYAPYVDVTYGQITFSIYANIPNVGNPYAILGYQTFYSLSGLPYTEPIYRVYNNSYTEFETQATSAQNEYYSAQTVIQYADIDSGRADLVASYGNIKDSSIASKIEQLGDLTAQYEKLLFEDNITDYLNRITDSDNAAELESLAQQITALDNLISKELIDYYRVQENIRREQRKDFTYDFNWLTDPYFGRDGGEFYVGKNIQQSLQQNQHTFLNLYTSGDMGDWMAGGNMYDSPRAGNILFNPLGSLNTTVFLGLENQNFSPSLPSTLANPEVFRRFGTLAGDRGFSVLNFGIKK